MTNRSAQFIYSVGRQAISELKYWINRVFLAMLKTPLPKIMVILLFGAILLSLIPLLITVGLALLLFKLFISFTAQQGHSRVVKRKYVVFQDESHTKN